MNDDSLASLSQETNQEIEKEARKSQEKNLEEKAQILRRDFLAEDFFEQDFNIYETIIVISQRARQIGQQQARIVEQFLASRVKPDSDDLDDDKPLRSFDDDDDDVPRLPQFEKATILAMNEMAQGEINYKYKDNG